MAFCFIPSEELPSPVKTPSSETSPVSSTRQHRDSDRYCQLCNAWFNNPGMAQQHYDGKKHKKNAARADLLEQLGKTLDVGEMKGTKCLSLSSWLFTWLLYCAAGGNGKDDDYGHRCDIVDVILPVYMCMVCCFRMVIEKWIESITFYPWFLLTGS